MKKLSLIITLILCSIYSFLASASDLKNIKLPLYTIEKEGKLSYIVGAYHALPLNAIHQEVKEILTSQDYLILESLSNPQTHSNVLLQENDQKWWNFLTPKEKDILSSISSVENIENYNLWFVGFSLVYWINLELTKDKNLSYEEQKKIRGFEDSLKTIYDKDKTFGLETSDEVNEVLSKSILIKEFNDLNVFKHYIQIVELLQKPVIANRRFVVEFLRQYFKLTKEFENFDNEKVETKIHLTDNLVKDRNWLWVDRIEDFHKTLNRGVVFVVGKNHLYGNQGLLKLLAERDFKITKLNFDSRKSEF